MNFDPNRPYPPDPYSVLPPVPSFSLTSTDIAPSARLAAPQSGDGGSVSPQLAWSGFPDQTKSFLLTVFDPDAPMPGAYWHWLVADIAPVVTEVPTGGGADSSTGAAGAVDLRNTSGAPGFIGAAPPYGDHEHRYYFAVHALDVAHLDISADAEPAEVAAAAVPRTLARAVLMGTFSR